MSTIDYSIFVDPQTKIKLTKSQAFLLSKEAAYPILQNGIPNLIFPKQLSKEEEESKSFYEGRAQQYEDTLHLTFFTHNENEEIVREGFIDKLKLNTNSKVLEIACGTGRDSVLIAKRLSGSGELHVQDISEDMISVCLKKIESTPIKKSFCLSTASYLPYPDKYFDATYSFGAMGEFSDKKLALKEMVRVTKPGGKIVFGDESVPQWHRNTEFYRILLKTNPMFSEEVPFEDLPVEARKVSVSWVIGGTFYLVDFEVGEGEPTANFDYEIPGVRGGTYRTRYEGQLEGINPETKKRAWEFVRKNGTNMHQWLEDLINSELNK